MCACEYAGHRNKTRCHMYQYNSSVLMTTILYISYLHSFVQHTSDKDSFRMVKVGRELKVDIPWVIWYTITDELLLLSSSSDQDYTHSYTPFYMLFYWLTWRFVLFYPIPIIISYITLLSTHTYTHTVKHVHLFITEPVAQLVLACATQMAVIDYCPVYGCWTHQALLLIWSYMFPSSATHPNRP